MKIEYLSPFVRTQGELQNHEIPAENPLASLLQRKVYLLYR
jgi:hypothetical protein